MPNQPSGIQGQECSCPAREKSWKGWFQGNCSYSWYSKARSQRSWHQEQVALFRGNISVSQFVQLSIRCLILYCESQLTIKNSSASIFPYRFTLPPFLTLKNFEGLDLGKMDKVSSPSNCTAIHQVKKHTIFQFN